MASRCAACGRLLADPASKARRLGPVCFRRLGGRTELRPFIPAPTVTPDQIPGQTEIDIQPTQTALTWSL